MHTLQCLVSELDQNHSVENEEVENPRQYRHFMNELPAQMGTVTVRLASCQVSMSHQRCQFRVAHTISGFNLLVCHAILSLPVVPFNVTTATTTKRSRWRRLFNLSFQWNHCSYHLTVSTVLLRVVISWESSIVQ
jgi:hypothetical protein